MQQVDRKMKTIATMLARIITCKPELFSKNGMIAATHVADWLKHRSHTRMSQAEHSLASACILVDQHHMLRLSEGFGDNTIYWLVYSANLIDCNYTYAQWHQSSITHVLECLAEVYVLEEVQDTMEP